MLIALIVLVCVTIAAVWFAPIIGERRKQQAHLRELMVEVEQEKQALALNVSMEDLLRRDPDFASIYARDRLGLGAPDETVFVFPQAHAAPAPAPVNR